MHHFKYIIISLLATIAAAALDSLLGSFELAGESGVAVMHAALLSTGKLAFLDKVEESNKVFLPNGSAAYCCIYDPATRDVKALSAVTNPFCCAGAFLADGRLVTLGGNGPLDIDKNVFDGFDAIRYLDAEGRQDGWKEPGNKLSSKRWYATAQVMSDGSVFVASGSLNSMNPYDMANNNPTYEILDRNGISNGKSVIMDILQRNVPYYMYPHLALLTDGSLFILVNTQTQLFDVPNNKVIRDLPNLPGAHRNYPGTGGSVLLPLSMLNDHSPEVMICGGGFSDGAGSPADASCGRMLPLSTNPEWKITNMPEGRVMVEGINLLDGTILWVNGAKQGAQGFGIADQPALTALIYNPILDTFTTAGTSTIARLYHSIAIMLQDGTILITGSNPNEQPRPWPYNATTGLPGKDLNPADLTTKYPTEYRNEIWTPPYLQGDKVNLRPVIIKFSATKFKPGQRFEVSFKPPGLMSSIDIILYSGGFVTHSLHMGQVMFKLEHRGWIGFTDGTFLVDPKIPNVKMAPGPYWVYVVANGVPATGQSVMIL